MAHRSDNLSQQRKSLILRYLPSAADDLDAEREDEVGFVAEVASSAVAQVVAATAVTVVVASDSLSQPRERRHPRYLGEPPVSLVAALAHRRRRFAAVRRAFWAEHTTLVWCFMGAVVALAAGVGIPHL